MMSFNGRRKQTGAAVEQAAADYLERAGYSVLFRNWYGKTGELDIVCRLKDTIHIVEVRCRKESSPVDPLETVTKKKAEALLRTAGEFLYVHGFSEDYVSIDLLSCRSGRDGVQVVSFLENVLQSSSMFL